MQEDSKNKLGIGKNPKTFGILIALVAIPVAVGLFSTVQHKNAKSSKVLAAKTQVDDIMVKVGKLMDLPQETPTVATVSDASKLAGQEFFAHALNGDKVIIFPIAKKAILYRPATNKIIEVALYNPPSVTPEASVEPSPTSVPIKSLREFIKNPTSEPVAHVSPLPSKSVQSVSPSPAPSASPSTQP